MSIRRIALALALAWGLSAAAQARPKQHLVKARRVKPRKYKTRKFKAQKIKRHH